MNLGMKKYMCTLRKVDLRRGHNDRVRKKQSKLCHMCWLRSPACRKLIFLHRSDGTLQLAALVLFGLGETTLAQIHQLEEVKFTLRALACSALMSLIIFLNSCFRTVVLVLSPR